MEQNFQTSFIPKKPLVEEKVVTSRPIGFFTIIAIFIFFSVALASGGFYFYKQYLTKQVDSMTKQLDIVKNRFEPSQIARLQELSKRLDGATSVLSKHVAISPIFQSLQDLTLKTIRYTKFSYSTEDMPNSKIKVKMTGQAVGYRSIALQSDLFSKNKDIIDPVFSNLSLDNKGNVVFDLEFSVAPSFVNYEKLIKTTMSATQ